MTKTTAKQTILRWSRLLGRNLLDLIRGKKISVDFFIKHKGMVIVITLMPVMYMAAKYDYLLEIDRMRDLEKDLQVVKTERLRVQNLYMSKIRESEITHMVDSLKLGLTIQKNPPFKVTY